MSGGGGNTTVQKADPWEGVQPYLKDLFASAQNYFKGPGPQYFPSDTVAPQSSDTLAAQDLMRRRAFAGSPLVPTAQGQASRTLMGDYLSNPATDALRSFGNGDFSGNVGTQQLANTASGSFLNANPYIDATFKRAADQVGRQFSQNTLPGIASMFSSAGRYGSNQMANAVDQAGQQYGNTLDNLATSIYGGNYANERQLQQGAAGALGNLSLGSLGELGSQFGRERTLMAALTGQAPGLAQADYADPGVLASIGGQQDAFNQGKLNSEIDRFNFGQMQPQGMLNFYNSILNGTGSLGGTTTTTGPGGSRLMGALGGGLMGSSILPALGSAGLLGSTAAASGLMGGAGINALGGLALGPAGLIGGALLGGLLM